MIFDHVNCLVSTFEQQTHILINGLDMPLAVNVLTIDRLNRLQFRFF